MATIELPLVCAIEYVRRMMHARPMQLFLLAYSILQQAKLPVVSLGVVPEVKVYSRCSVYALGSRTSWIDLNLRIHISPEIESTPGVQQKLLEPRSA